jgi:MoaA/NifB/PqqE/SkfB family radical SAM enzyme
MRTARDNPRRVPGLVGRRLKARFSRHFTALLKGWSYPPETVNIYPTAGCNLKCAMCFIRFFKSPGDLAIDQWKTIVDQFKKFRPRIHLSGGEPFLYPDIVTLIEHIKNCGLIIHITTNGTFLDKYAETVAEAGVSQIDISIDGMKETHDRIRGVPGTFVKVMAGLAKLKQAKKGRPLPVIKLNSILNFERPSDMEKLLAMVADYDVREAQFLHPLFLDKEAVDLHRMYLRQNLGRDINGWAHADRHRVKPDNIKEVMAIADGLIKNNPVRVSVFPDFTPEQLAAYYNDDRRLVFLVKPRCRAMWDTATILSTGELESCPDYVVGNCRESHFAQLWNGEPMRSLRRRIRYGEYFTVCRACCFFY